MKLGVNNQAIIFETSTVADMVRGHLCKPNVDL